MSTCDEDPAVCPDNPLPGHRHMWADGQCQFCLRPRPDVPLPAMVVIVEEVD